MYKALRSFSGLISMIEGEVREISDQSLVKDLLRAGHIEEVKSEKKPVSKPKTAKK